MPEIYKKEDMKMRWDNKNVGFERPERIYGILNEEVRWVRLGGRDR